MLTATALEPNLVLSLSQTGLQFLTEWHNKQYSWRGILQWMGSGALHYEQAPTQIVAQFLGKHKQTLFQHS